MHENRTRHQRAYTRAYRATSIMHRTFKYVCKQNNNHGYKKSCCRILRSVTHRPNSFDHTQYQNSKKKMERQSKINLYQHQLMHLINLDLNIPRESAKMLYYGLRDLFELTDEVEIEKINLKKFISKLKQDAANVEHLRSEEKKKFENQILRSKLKQDSANVEHLRSEEKKSFEKQLLVEKSLNTQQQLQINELLTKCKKLKKLELENESLKSEALKKFENSQLSDKNSDSDSSAQCVI